MDDGTRHEWITVAELVRRTNGGISASLVTRMCRDGLLESINVGREGARRARWLIRANALELLLEKQRGSAA